MPNKFLELLNFSILCLFAILLFLLTIFGIYNWKDARPPSKYTNTLQRDINR